MLIKNLVLACMLATTSAATLAQSASAPASAPAASPAKKALVARILKIQQPGIENLARQLVERPAVEMLQQVGPALQRLPADKREAVAKDIQADARKYAEDAGAVVRDRAVKLAPSTMGALLEERFSEDELKRLIAIMDSLESPVNRKFQQLAPEVQKTLGGKLLAETRATVEPQLRALQQSIEKRLKDAAAAAPAAAPASAAKP